MTENYYRTGFCEVDHRTFGGYINESDFNTENRGKDNRFGSSIADRIASDMKFDKQCKKNAENRDNGKTTQYGKQRKYNQFFY